MQKTEQDTKGDNLDKILETDKKYATLTEYKGSLEKRNNENDSIIRKIPLLSDKDLHALSALGIISDKEHAEAVQVMSELDDLKNLYESYVKSDLIKHSNGLAGLVASGLVLSVYLPIANFIGQSPNIIHNGEYILAGMFGAVIGMASYFVMKRVFYSLQEKDWWPSKRARLKHFAHALNDVNQILSKAETLYATLDGRFDPDNTPLDEDRLFKLEKYHQYNLANDLGCIKSKITEGKQNLNNAKFSFMPEHKDLIKRYQ